MNDTNFPDTMQSRHSRTDIPAHWPERTLVTGMDSYYLTKSWKGKRQYVVQRDGGWCRYCGGRGVQADHVVPRMRGGSDKVKNLVCSCPTCNRIAGNRVFRSIEQKRAYIRRQLGMDTT